MSTHTKQQTHMHTKSSNVRSSLTRDPKDSKVSVIVKFNEFHVMNGSNAELSLDSGNERRALEESSSESLDCLGELLFRVDGFMETENGDVLLSYFCPRVGVYLVY